MKKRIMIAILMIILSSIMAANAISPWADIENVTVDVVNVTDGEPFKNKATELADGDSVICFCEYRDNVQYSKGVHIDHWYVGDDEEDIDPHHTEIVKEILFYKNDAGQIINKTHTLKDGFDGFPLIDGYTPFKAQVFYQRLPMDV